VGVAEGMPTQSLELCRLRWVMAMVGAVGQAMAVLTNTIIVELALLGVTGAITVCLVVVITVSVFGFGDAAKSDGDEEGDERLSLTDALNALGMMNAIIGVVLMAVNIVCAITAIVRNRTRMKRAVASQMERAEARSQLSSFRDASFVSTANAARRKNGGDNLRVSFALANTSFAGGAVKSFALDSALLGPSPPTPSTRSPALLPKMRRGGASNYPHLSLTTSSLSSASMPTIGLAATNALVDDSAPTAAITPSEPSNLGVSDSVLARNAPPTPPK